MDDKFLEFKWKGIDKQGKRLKGIIRASGIKTVESELKSRDIEVIRIDPIKKRMNITFFQKKIKFRDIVYFTRYLATMLSADMPILKALEVISHDPENKLMQSLVISVHDDVASGKNLADSFAKYPNYFNPLYCNLVRAGEKSGTLSKILKHLALYLEKTELLKSKIKKALIYPCAIIVVTFIVGFILLVFVMPQFETMFKSYNVQLPMFTRVVIGISNALRGYWWLMLLAVVGLIWGTKRILKKYEYLALLKDTWILKLFILGPMLKKAIIERFTSTLSITIEAGLSIVEAMQSMVNIMDNRLYSQEIQKICKEIIEGNSLSSSLSHHPNLFPNMVIQMVAVGEASGALPEMLNNIARHYEEEVNVVVDSLSALLEPFIIVLLGIIIGSFIIAMYLPIFRLGSLF